MKYIKFYTSVLIAALAIFNYSCSNGEEDLLESKLYFENNTIKIETEEDTYDCEIVSRLSGKAGNDVNVTYSVGGQELVDIYNQKHGTTAQLLPEANYELVENSSLIKSGDIYASPCDLNLKNITKGEEGVTYVLPLLVNSSDISIMSGENVAYVVVKKPVIINKVYGFSPYWLDVRLPAKFKSVQSVTYEALVYATSWNMLGTIMGNEGVLIMRTGDLNHPANELQIAGNVQLQMPDVSAWTVNKWYHIAFTYDASSGIATLYLNGNKLVDKTVGSVSFDLNSRFCIGYAYDYDSKRKWNGYMSEVRLWSVARTANQLKESMLYVDPNTAGLEGYWKLNGEDYENREGVWYVLDQTKNHNDATSNSGRRGDTGGTQTFTEPNVVEMRVKIE